MDDAHPIPFFEQILAKAHLCGAGLAVVPEFLAEQGIISCDVQYVLPDWTLDPIDVFATWPSNAPKYGLIKLFIGEICPEQSLK